MWNLIVSVPDRCLFIYFTLFAQIFLSELSWRFYWSKYEPPHDKTKQNDLSAQSDQSLRCGLNGYLRTKLFFMRTTKTLIRLGGWPGWSESSLGAHDILLVLSWGGSYIFCMIIQLFRIRVPKMHKTPRKTFWTYSYIKLMFIFLNLNMLSCNTKWIH